MFPNMQYTSTLYSIFFSSFMQNTLPPLTLTVLQAVDDDSNGNALIAYSFEDFATTSGPFQINRDTGSVFLRSGPAGSLDRETRDIYEVSNRLPITSY